MAGIKDIAVTGAKLVREFAEAQPGKTDFIYQYSPESFTGTEIDYAIEVCEAVMDVWQPTTAKKCIFNLPATVEMSTPNIYADQIEYFCRNMRAAKTVISRSIPTTTGAPASPRRNSASWPAPTASRAPCSATASAPAMSIW